MPRCPCSTSCSPSENSVKLTHLILLLRIFLFSRNACKHQNKTKWLTPASTRQSSGRMMQRTFVTFQNVFFPFLAHVVFSRVYIAVHVFIQYNPWDWLSVQQRFVFAQSLSMQWAHIHRAAVTRRRSQNANLTCFMLFHPTDLRLLSSNLCSFWNRNKWLWKN